MSKMKCKRLCVMLTLSLLLVCMMGTTAFAAGTGDVAGAVESTWATASTQIKTVVNNVVFPAIDLILAVFFFAKLGTAYFDYRKHRLTRAHREKQLKTSCQALHNAPPNRT